MYKGKGQGGIKYFQKENSIKQTKRAVIVLNRG